MVQRRPASPQWGWVFSLASYGSPLWWWGVWDVGDGWPVLLLMVPPLPPCGLWWWGVWDVGDGVYVCVCVYVCMQCL